MDFLAGLALDLGVQAMMYQESIQDEIGLSLKVGYEDKPLYLALGYDEPTARMLGQPISELSIATLGLGWKHTTGNFSVFGEMGWSFIDQSNRSRIQQEIVYTYLVSRHNVEYRPIPVQPTGPYDQDSYETLYEIDDAFYGRVGMGYQVTDLFKMTLSYRYSQADTHYELWDADRRAAGGGWWQESDTIDLSAFEVGVHFTF